MQYRHILLFFVLFFAKLSLAQRNVNDSIIGTPWCGVAYGANWTGGDLKERYGYTSHISLMAGYKTKRNWVYSIDANYHFCDRVNFGDPYAALRDSKGNLTDQNGDIAIVLISHRGVNVNASIGRVIPVLSPNRNSGLFLQFGSGFYGHKMRSESVDHFVPSVENEYKKGYDRLTQGINTSEFIGYAFMANRGIINFYGGLYFMQGFTRNQRNIFFDQPNTPVSKDLRMDLQYGIKLGWFIPIYKRLPKEFYYD